MLLWNPLQTFLNGYSVPGFAIYEIHKGLNFLIIENLTQRTMFIFMSQYNLKCFALTFRGTQPQIILLLVTVYTSVVAAVIRVTLNEKSYLSCLISFWIFG